MIHPLASRNPEALPVGMTSQRGAPNKSRLVPPLVVLLGLFLAGSGTWLRAEPGAGKSSPPSAAKEKEVILRDFHGDPLPPGAVARLGTVRGRHGGPITSLAWSSDSKRLLTSGSDSLVRLWDPNTGKELRRFTGNTDNIDGVALSPDDKLVASAGEDGTVRAWEVDSGKVRFAHEGVLAGKPLRCVAFSPDGKLLAAGGGSSGDSGLVLLAMPSGKVLHTLGDGKAFLPCVAFSPDGKLLAAAEDPQPWNNKPGRKEKAPAGVRLWDVATGKEQRFLGEHPGIMSVAFSPDGKGLATGGRDTNVCLWDVGTGKLLRRMAVPPTESRNSFVRTGHRASYAVAFSPDGRWLASANHNATVTLWNLHARKHTTLLGHSGGVIALAFSPDSKRLATGSYDSTFRIWDPVTGKPLHTPPAHSGAVRALAISPDGKVAATMGSDHTVRLWDPRTGRPGRALHRPEMEFTLFTLTLAFSPDGRRLAWPEGKGIRFWELSGKAEPTGALDHPTRPISLAFSPDGKWLATTAPAGPDQQLHLIHLWDLAEDKEVATIRPPRPYAWGVSFSPDSKWLAARMVIAGGVEVWDVATRKEVRHIPGPGGFAFSPDGKTLATSENRKAVKLWNLEDGTEQGLLRPPSSGYEPIIPTTFSPDGRLLVCVEETVDKEASVMEVATGKLRRKLTGHRGLVSTVAVAFTPDGRYLVTGSQDTTALVWDVWDGGRVWPATMSARHMRSAWEALAGADGVAAGEAIARLAATRGQAVRFLGEHLRPVKPLDPEALAKLIADLDSDSFAVRQRAVAELKKLGERATGALREAAKKGRSLELRRRAEELLRPYAGLVTTAEGMRAVRAVEVLERVATPEARELLHRLAGGAPGARLTEEARAALGRKGKGGP